jgi:hypothetical protein
MNGGKISVNPGKKTGKKITISPISEHKPPKITDKGNF